MASTASPPFSSPIPISRFRAFKPRRMPAVMASDTSGEPAPRRKEDTRIHWSNPDEGWIGGKTRSSDDTTDYNKKKQKDHLGERFADLINKSTTSHYQFLGVSAEADTEEIRAAYRRLSKEYHPDTTSLPLKAASEKFMQLREAYKVLNDVERRRFYDWTLAQEAESQRAERMRRMELADPYEEEVRNYESVPDMVDRLGGRNMKLSDQAMTALTVDIFIIIFTICSVIVYVLVVKET